MLPSALEAKHFASYPPKGRELAVNSLPVLRTLPLQFAPFLLRELISFDWRFPVEQEQVHAQVRYLGQLSAAERAGLFSGFAAISIPQQLADVPWVQAPSVFIEQLTAHLWASKQVEALTVAANAYAAALGEHAPVSSPGRPRLLMVAVGQGCAETPHPLFRKLRPHGVLFTKVQPEGGLALLQAKLRARAAAQPTPFAHWYIDGGAPAGMASAGAVQGGSGENGNIAALSYASLAPLRKRLLANMRTATHSGGIGPEDLRSQLSSMRPEDLGLHSTSEHEATLQHFQVNLLTEGSGTQIFATSFVQWAGREALRRAQPETMLVRFTPRQRQRSMDEMLFADTEPADLDPQGSLVDADMGSYLLWLDLQRLPGSEVAVTLAWFEGMETAIAIGPGFPKGATSGGPIRLDQILA